MIPGEMVIEKVHGLQCTNITLGERFALIMAEHHARVARLRRRAVYNKQNTQFRWIRTLNGQVSPRELTMFQQPRQAPMKQIYGMPALRRFGSDSNLPGVQRSNSFGSFTQFRNRIPWRQSNSNLSRAGSATDLSQASWHGDGNYRRGRSVRGRMRGRGRKPQQMGQLRQQNVRAVSVPARGGGRARGRARGVLRNQQNHNQQTGGFQLVNRKQQTGGFQFVNRNKQTGGLQFMNRNQQTGGFQSVNRNQQAGGIKFVDRSLKAGGVQVVNRNQKTKVLPTKEELDAQLDEYMASSQHILDKELEEYMLKGAMMECE